MPRQRLINKHVSLINNTGYQVVFYGDSKLRRNIISCDSLESAQDLVRKKQTDVEKRKPRRNFYTIWLRKSVWVAVVLETGILKKSV